MKRISLTAICIIAATVSFSGMFGLGWETHQMIGKSVPDFSLTSYADAEVSSASLKGNVYILTFWFPG